MHARWLAVRHSAAPARWLTPPQIARELVVEPAKVLAWIHRGELRACNLADRLGGRARWKVSPAELERFLAARQAGPAPKRRRKRRELVQADEWF
jgi:hypothetical protein